MNFNAVECPIKKRRSYLVFISNDGQMGTISNPLPFVPYDSRCMECNTSQVTNTANCNLKVSLRPIYTKRQSQHYDHSAMRLGILFSWKTMESLQNGIATHF